MVYLTWYLRDKWTITTRRKSLQASKAKKSFAYITNYKKGQCNKLQHLTEQSLENVGNIPLWDSVSCMLTYIMCVLKGQFLKSSLFRLGLHSLLQKKQNRRGKMAPEDDDSRIDSFQKERDARIALLEKENFELRQEVLRLKAQISSLKAHDNERKSMLWKKLQNPNTDTSPQKQTDFVKTQEFQNLDGETFRPRPGFQELEAGKERSIKVPKPPPRHASENKVQTPVAFPAPPPPPLPSKFLAGSKTVRRVPEVVELYRSLTRKDAHMENRSNTTAAPVIAFTRNMIGEIENRSTYLSAIKTDVKKQKEFINFLIKEVESAVFDQISEVEAFVKWLDGELSSLVDERAVLKHFPQWPERKADALREAACNYRDLKNLEQEVSSFEDNQKESLPQATRKMQALQDRLEQRVNGMERMRESTGKKYRDFQIPCDWMMDSGLIGQMKVSSLRLAKEYMKRVSKELQSSECWREDNLMLQGVRFAYRVHQFAGGFDAETIQAFEELKKVGLSSHK